MNSALSSERYSLTVEGMTYRGMSYQGVFQPDPVIYLPTYNRGSLCSTPRQYCTTFCHVVWPPGPSSVEPEIFAESTQFTASR